MITLFFCISCILASYENPYTVPCGPKELNMSVSNTPGLYCAPKCSNLYPLDECPQDKPEGATALGECMIAVNSTENNYCALMCNTEAIENQCGEKSGAKCQHVYGNQGICTYTQPAPETFQLDFITDIGGYGVVTLNITRKWAPLGVERLYALVQDKFFDGAAFFRVIPNFVAQFGISGIPEENEKWASPIKDDPVLESNKQWTMSYATAGPNTRTTQLFINYNDNSHLNKSGFAPIGIVVSGQDILTKVTNPTPGDSNGVNQQEYEQYGNEWIVKNYPKINFINKVNIRVNNNTKTEVFNGKMDQGSFTMPILN